MRSIRALVPLSLFAVAQATSCSPSLIQWVACEEGEFNTTLPVECGTLRVPLDYSQPDSNKTIALEILKIPALVQPSKGSIFTNFGGPGIESRTSLIGSAPILQPLSGGQYDLLAFDPRGTGSTMPFECLPDGFLLGIMGSELSWLGNSSDIALGRQWARGAADSNICFESNNGTGDLLGTAFVVRDMISVVDALGEDGMLRYWGFSYGTTLGATAAAMFPERIDRMIIDGVSNIHEYYNANADFQQWSDSDKAFSSIFIACAAAGPDNCDLAKSYETAAEIEQAVWDLLETLKYHPIVIGSAVVDYSLLKGYLGGVIKDTSSWQSAATLLDMILRGDPEELAAPISKLYVSVTDPDSVGAAERLWAIHCSDRIVRASTYEEIEPTFTQLLDTSRLFGDQATQISAHCAQWKFHAKEQYAGDFNVKTKNPMLIVSNTIDGHTPLRSAQNATLSFEGSGLLEVNGTGHCSLSLPSACLVKQTAAYWLEGTLPEPGTVCAVDAPPYTNITWFDVLLQLAGNETTLQKREAYTLPPLGSVGRRWSM